MVLLLRLRAGRQAFRLLLLYIYILQEKRESRVTCETGLRKRRRFPFPATTRSACVLCVCADHDHKERIQFGEILVGISVRCVLKVLL